MPEIDISILSRHMDELHGEFYDFMLEVRWDHLWMMDSMVSYLQSGR